LFLEFFKNFLRRVLALGESNDSFGVGLTRRQACEIIKNFKLIKSFLKAFSIHHFHD
jgi:hypothetical protein